MVRFLGILPTVTIGPLKTTRISFASASVASSPIGPALTMVTFLVSWASAAAAKQMSAAAAKRFMGRSLTAGCGIVGDGLWRECGRAVARASCQLPVAGCPSGLVPGNGQRATGNLLRQFRRRHPQQEPLHLIAAVLPQKRQLCL